MSGSTPKGNIFGCRELFYFLWVNVSKQQTNDRQNSFEIGRKYDPQIMRLGTFSPHAPLAYICTTCPLPIIMR